MAPPVVLVHGFLADPLLMLPMRKRLAAHGFDVHLVHMSFLALRNQRRLTRQLARGVEQVRIATGEERVILIGVSLGGLLALNYVQKHGGADKVERIVTIGSPFRGTWFALVGLPVLGLVSRGLWQTLPTSPLLRELREGGCPVPVTTISVARDPVAPPARCHLEGAENVVLAPTWSPAPHQWLVMSKTVTDRIAEILTHEGAGDP